MLSLSVIDAFVDDRVGIHNMVLEESDFNVIVLRIAFYSSTSMQVHVWYLKCRPLCLFSLEGTISE